MATAYVLINCELGSEEAIIQQLKGLDGVKEVHGSRRRHTRFWPRSNLIQLKNYEKQLRGKLGKLKRFALL